MAWLIAAAAYFAIVAGAPLAAVAIAESRENAKTREFVAFMESAWSDR